jgi:prepilin peptidase CpaA
LRCWSSALFAFDVLGGGDVKLLSAIALWAGWSLMLPLLFITSVAGAVLAIILLAVRRFAPRNVPQGRWYRRLVARGEGVPYGIAIAIAGLSLLPRIAAPVLR